MVVRHSTEGDIPGIVELLKMSLGESLLPKSEAYWRWKHVDNPFGKSPVLLAEEDGVLVGVRAFMRWEWTNGTEIHKAVRAVDTATHPDHQGKGIFKKLTLQLIDECRENGVHFIFNTPNTQSKPGYIKMGWKDAGRLPIRFIPGNLLAVVFSSLFGKPTDHKISTILQLVSNSDLLFNKSNPDNKLRTNNSIQYLHWRYAQVPVAEYSAIYLNEKSQPELLIYRLKKSKLGIEFRITDWLGKGTMSREMKKLITKEANRCKASYITFSGVSDALASGFRIEKGPAVTVRDIQYPAFDTLAGFQNWKPSLGDLELF